MPDLKINVLRKGNETGEVPLFAMLRNEICFLPHWLRHYRDLGIKEFLLFDDRSDDGTREYLLSQDDCTIFQGNHAWGDVIKSIPFSFYIRHMICRKFAKHRWLLSVDADEFLVLPSQFESVCDLTAVLSKNQINCCRAVMIDFFPERMTAVTNDKSVSPFDLCPYFDSIVLKWHDLQKLPEFSLDGVRPRLFEMLLQSGEGPKWSHTYEHAKVGKLPLLYWTEKTVMRNDHVANVNPRDSAQMVLAHFKFYPGWLDRVAFALDSKGTLEQLGGV